MKIKGKYIVAFDTLCSGWQTYLDENNHPVLYDSELEAYKEVLDDCLSSVEHDKEVSSDTIKKIKELIKKGSLEEIKSFFGENPEINIHDEFVIPAKDFVNERKVFFNGMGGKITGQSIEQWLESLK